MASLLNFFSSIGVNSPKISVLGVAQQFLSGPPFSVNGLIQTASESESFTTLPIFTEGSGDFRANRFRIYFRHPGFFQLSVSDLVTELGNLFPQIFNGFGEQVDGSGLTTNVATTFYRFDKPFNGEPTLQFTADIRVLFEFMNAPDLHDDWVGFVHQDANSFAVQTLERNFTQGNDAKFGLLIAEAVAAVTLNPVNAVVGGIATGVLNRYHFLAGRRSWMIAQANLARGPVFSADHPIASPQQGVLPDHVYVLETAAVERFSSWVVRLADVVPGVVLSNMDALIAEVWTILLSNYVKFKGFEQVEVNSLATPVFPNSLRGVTFIQEAFGSPADALAADWVQDLRSLHPGIAEEF